MFCKCGRKARISRPHEGRAYCEQCLIRLVRRRVKRELRKLGIEKGDKVVIFVPRCSRFHALLLEELEKIFAKWKELRLIALIFDFEEKTSTEPKIGKIEMKRLRIPSQPKSCQECINTQLEICKKFLGDNEAKIMTSLVLEEILTLFLRTFLEGTPIFLWSPLGFLRGREARICSEFLKPVSYTHLTLPTN